MQRLCEGSQLPGACGTEAGSALWPRERPAGSLSEVGGLGVMRRAQPGTCGEGRKCLRWRSVSEVLWSPFSLISATQLQVWEEGTRSRAWGPGSGLGSLEGGRQSETGLVERQPRAERRVRSQQPGMNQMEVGREEMQGVGGIVPQSLRSILRD